MSEKPPPPLDLDTDPLDQAAGPELSSARTRALLERFNKLLNPANKLDLTDLMASLGRFGRSTAAPTYGHRGFHHIDRAAVDRRRAENKAARRARRMHRLAARR